MAKSSFRRIYEIAWKIVDKFTTDNITLYAAQTCYFIVVSIIPFAIIMVPLMTLLIPDGAMEVMMEMIKILPGTLGSIAEKTLAGLFVSPDISVVSIYVLLSLWAASKGIMSLQNGLHGIYHVQDRENYFIRRFRCTLYTLVFLLVLVLAFLLLVLGNTLENLLSTTFSFWAVVAKIFLAFRILISVTLFILTFTAGYKYLAGSMCTFLDALPGVLVTTAAWFIFSTCYGIYITYFTRYITLYGSLGALALLFLWLYFCIVILMIGAEFNVYLSERRQKKQLDKDAKKREKLLAKEAKIKEKQDKKAARDAKKKNFAKLNLLKKKKTDTSSAEDIPKDEDLSDRNEGYPSDSGEGHPSDSEKGYPSGSGVSYPSDSEESHPSGSGEGYPSDSGEGHPSESDE